jgi:thiamine pyrophosphokinase
MLGVVFIGGEGPPPEISRPLAARADILAAADSGLVAAEAAGFSPRWIIGDMDSVGDLSRLDAYPPERVLRYPHEKDYTDTELALFLLWDKGCDEVWILGGGGGRVDHLFALRALFERDRFPRRWVTAADDIWALEAQDVLTLASAGRGPQGRGAGKRAVNFVRGTTVAAAPLGNGPWKAASGGLKWPLDDVLWNRGFFGASNEASEGELSVKVERGRFMILLPLRGEYVCDDH